MNLWPQHGTTAPRTTPTRKRAAIDAVRRPYAGASPPLRPFSLPGLALRRSVQAPHHQHGIVAHRSACLGCSGPSPYLAAPPISPCPSLVSVSSCSPHLHTTHVLTYRRNRQAQVFSTLSRSPRGLRYATLLLSPTAALLVGRPPTAPYCRSSLTKNASAPSLSLTTRPRGTACFLPASTANPHASAPGGDEPAEAEREGRLTAGRTGRAGRRRRPPRRRPPPRGACTP